MAQNWHAHTFWHAAVQGHSAPPLSFLTYAGGLSCNVLVAFLTMCCTIVNVLVAFLTMCWWLFLQCAAQLSMCWWPFLQCAAQLSMCCTIVAFTYRTSKLKCMLSEQPLAVLPCTIFLANCTCFTYAVHFALVWKPPVEFFFYFESIHDLLTYAARLALLSQPPVKSSLLTLKVYTTLLHMLHVLLCCGSHQSSPLF